VPGRRRPAGLTWRSAMTDLVQHISEIARLFWGPENRALSSRTELRWEKRRPRGQSQHRTVVRPFRVCRRRRCRLNATALRAICVAAGIPFAGLKGFKGLSFIIAAKGIAASWRGYLRRGGDWELGGMIAYRFSSLTKLPTLATSGARRSATDQAMW
jgi:hypothetical protein